MSDTGDELSDPGDADVTPRLRPYALTRGRTRSEADLPFETLVRRTEAGLAALPRMTLERAQILELCAQAMSVAELSAHLSVHLGVARVLVGDMTSEGLLDIYRPQSSAGDRPDIKLLERVLDGLQAL